MSELVSRLRRMQSLTILGGSLAGEAADEIESLRQQLAAALASPTIEACRQMIEAQAVKENAELHQQLADSQQALRNVYEVWAGSEGIPKPENAREEYLRYIIIGMRDAANEGMK